MTPFALDFKAIPPLRFDLSTTAQDKPRTEQEQDDAKADAARGKAGATFLSSVRKRRLAGIKRAAEVLTVLPEEGESLHGILLGYFDLCSLLLAMLDKVGSPCSRLRIATLSFSKRNVAELAVLLDAGTVRRLDLLTSDFQREHDSEILEFALQELRVKRGQRLAAARSHCKIVSLALDDGRRYVIEGSANLRTSRNAEQFSMSRDDGLHDFYASWFDGMVSAHEIGQS